MFSSPASKSIRASSFNNGSNVRIDEETLDSIRGSINSSFKNYREIYNEDGTIEIMDLPTDPKPVGDEQKKSRTNKTLFNENIIISSGKPDDQSIVLTIMGDGYTADQQEDFIDSAQRVVEFLLGNPDSDAKGFYPYNLFRDFFTVYAIEVISNESGVSRDADYNNNHIVDNYFGSSFYGGEETGTVERRLDIKKYHKAYELVKSDSPTAVIICNSTRWGGTGGDISIISSHSRNGSILTHEMGHTLGGLADEYWVNNEHFNLIEAPNKTNNGDLNTIKWANWIGYAGKFGGISAYRYSYNEGDISYDWYKPHLSCHMQNTISQFCAVCAEELIYRMGLITGEFFSTTTISDEYIRIDNVNYLIYGEFEIPPIINKKIVEEIGVEAFKDQTMLSSITIHKNIIKIADNAFINCTNLNKVKLTRDSNNSVQLGNDVFYGCNQLKEIIVPTSRILEYKNAINWSYYSSYIVDTNSFSLLRLNCFHTSNRNTSLPTEKNRVYKLNVECPKSYKITSTATSLVRMSIYNANMNLIDGSTNELIVYLNPGIYYIDIRFDDDLASGTITTKYELRWPHTGWEVEYNEDNDVLTHLHQMGLNEYKNQLKYYNNNGAGFYEFTLNGTLIDDVSPYYPEGAITIYSNSSRSNILTKFSGYPVEAKTSENINRMVVYLPSSGYFYIDINMASNELASLDLRINPVTSQEINLFNLSLTSNEYINIFNETTHGEYFQKLIINQTGKFTFSTSYSGFQNNTLFILTKLEYDKITNTYSLVVKIIDELHAKDYPEPKTLNLEEGIYYIGYYNKNDNQPLNVEITRHVTLSGSHILMTDPESGALCGSQINTIEMNSQVKSYNELFITKSFTRIIYPNYNYIYDTSSSRLDYYWYSSNESIATVTDYGTVLGKNVGTVKIMAVLKEDPSKVFIKEFTIIEDAGTDPLIVNSTLTVNYSETDSGTFRLALEEVNCPYPWFQDYSWSLFIPEQENALTVYLDEWGNIAVNQVGGFVLTGSYLKNNRITVIIDVIVIP